MKHTSLTFRIFINTFLVGTLIYFICAFLFISSMYGYFEEQIFSELKTESSFLEQYVLNAQLEQLAALKTKNRITIMNAKGNVYFDNTVDISTLDSHAARQEFLEAKEKGTVQLTRYSSTMTGKILYYAQELSNGDILRISCRQHTVWILVLGMSQILLMMLVIAVIISGISASCISRKVVEPLNKIDLENPQNCEVYEELRPFTKRISDENFEKQQREELRQQFTANVSHELKTPLTSISGFAEILKDGGTDENTVKDFASSIYDEAQRMICLVNDIIKLSKLDERAVSQKKEPVSLRAVCKEVIETLCISAKKRNLTISLTGESGQIDGIKPILYEMIYNLVDNAIKYNTEGGRVDISIRSQQESSESQNHSDSSARTILTIKDTGIGIPEDEQERIFERFYRVDKSRSRQNGGTGLGLSIVKHAARYHDANILVKSEAGKGSTFTVIFGV